MSNSVTFQEISSFTSSYGSAFASAWSEGGKRYTQEAVRVLQESGQLVLTETQKMDIFVTQQAKTFQNLSDTAHAWADAAQAAGKTGIADIMRKYGEKAFAEADKIFNGVIDKKQWLDAKVADANVKIGSANHTIAQTGGFVGKVFGPILDAASMVEGAWDYTQTGDTTHWENACFGVGLSWLLGGGTALLLPVSLGFPAVLAIGFAAGVGSYLGSNYAQSMRDWLLQNETFQIGFDHTIGPLINTLFGSALNYVAPKDPLVLDLDGNGITTTPINPNAPILFDQDGDGTLTATGWIGAGEALVVRDLNANGRIDSGRELFGDSTVLTSGPRIGQKAANGFEALADLDSNADGQFDAADTAFTSVKLWKDANHNGISEAGELFSFADQGVASINVTGTASNVDLGGDNTQTFAGSFTRTSGQIGAAGTTELAGSLLLANNNFYHKRYEFRSCFRTSHARKGRKWCMGGKASQCAVYRAITNSAIF